MEEINENNNNNKYKESIIESFISNNESLINSTNIQENTSSLISQSNDKEYKKRDSSDEFQEKNNCLKPAKDKEDDFFKRKILGEEWIIHSKYVDIDLVQDHLSSFLYLWKECQDLETICNENLFNHAMSKKDMFESQNVRTIVRNGIPPKYMRTFIMKLFNINKNENMLINNYNKILHLVLRDYKIENFGNYVPYFNGFKKLEDSLPIHFLNKSGIFALKEILWMLYALYPQIEFCPLIIQLLSMILVFCNKYEALEIMSCIICFNINYNKNEIYKIRWHLRLNYNDNIKIITSISECLKEVSYLSGKELSDHMKSIHFRPERLYEDICFGFFYKYFNFFGMIRFLPFYLHEGIKSIYRLIYAIEKVAKDDLLLIKNPDKIIQKCRELCNSLTNIKDLFEISYNFNITRNNNKYIEQQNLPDNMNRHIKSKYYIIPLFTNQSNILTEYNIIHLWEHLPKDFKKDKASIIFRNENKGNITDIIKYFNNIKENIMFLFIIKTTMSEIFGFALFGKINYTNGNFIKNEKAYLFNIEPEIRFYNKVSESNDILFVDENNILLGKNLNENVTLRISGDLSKGVINQGECFNNPCFINKKDGIFEIKEIEIIRLEQFQKS